MGDLLCRPQRYGRLCSKLEPNTAGGLLAIAEYVRNSALYHVLVILHHVRPRNRMVRPPQPLRLLVSGLHPPDVILRRRGFDKFLIRITAVTNVPSRLVSKHIIRAEFSSTVLLEGNMNQAGAHRQAVRAVP